ncbi:MAG: acyl-CoA dehydrogenase [Pseudomonadales bacterium]|nr:acyl-CoA dehydrogenase [Pseudomonadales bacterium]
MDFALTEEQRMLHDSVSGYLASTCNIDVVREAAAEGQTHNAMLAQGLAELGVTSILVPEDFGGVGLGFLEAALIAESLGAVAAPVSFASTAVMAPVALLKAGSEEQQETHLPLIAAGEAVYGVAVTEQIGRRDSDGITAADGQLQGQAMFVLEGMDAGQIIVADSSGALYLVDAGAVQKTPLKTIDRTRSVAKIEFNNTPAELLPGSTTSREPLMAMIDAGRVMLAADTLGAGQKMVDDSIAYAKERRQFNRVIGSFQAVKHMCAEMAAQLEPCRSMVWYAAHAMDAMPDEARLMACHAKAHLSEVGQFVARTATEVHGGMGMTDLLGLHYWFKRIGLDRQLLGAPELVREEAARAQGWL